jgi:hypothetical protein
MQFTQKHFLPRCVRNALVGGDKMIDEDSFFSLIVTAQRTDGVRRRSHDA